jgi:hypothetical protein
MSTPEAKHSSSPVVGETSDASPNQQSQVLPVHVAGAGAATVDRTDRESYSDGPLELLEFGFRPSGSLNFTNPPKPMIIERTTETKLGSSTLRRRVTVGCVRSEKKYRGDHG